MKMLRILIVADALFLAVLGLGIGVFYDVLFPAISPGPEAMAALRLLGAALGGSALVLWAQSHRALTGDRRRLAQRLGVANLLIGAMALIQQIAMGGGLLGWALALYFLGFGVGLTWAGLRRLKPEGIAAELAVLQIPGEIRQALLQQVGEAAAQEERNRLARDLHDSIKQQLFSINVGAAAAQERWEGDPEGARKALADVRRSAREAMVEMQAMLHQLRPEALGTAGLIEALREQCEALGYRTGAAVTLELGEPVPDDRMPPGAQDTLFRIGQEMLANVARHARARKVRLWLGRLEEAVLLHVEDDGQGFSPGAEVPGMGLRNLKERAESLRGRLDVASTPGGGTRMQVWVPLTPEPPRISLRERSFTLTTNTSMMFGMLLLAAQPSDSNGPITRDFASLTIFLTAPFMIGAIVYMSRRELREGLRQFPGSGIADVARLHYAGHRARALAFLLGAWASRRGSHLSGGWGALFSLLTLVCLVLMGRDIFRAYRWSRWSRRLFEGWVRPAEWGCPRGTSTTLLFSLVLLGLGILLWICFLHRGFWAAPEQLQFIALGAALFAYFFWRRPLTEGAPS